MKGRLIVVILLALIIPVAYLALRDTNADLYRQFELLENCAQALEESLEKTLEPHEKVQSLKLTMGQPSIRLSNERNNLKRRVQNLRKSMRTLLISIDNCNADTKADTTGTMKQTREKADLILQDFNIYAMRVDLIASFVGDRIPLVKAISSNMERIEFFKSKKMGTGTPLPEDLVNRIEKLTADFRKAQRNGEETVKVAWENLEQATIFAGVTVNGLKECLSLAEALNEDMRRQMDSEPYLLQRHLFLVESTALLEERLNSIREPINRLRARDRAFNFDAQTREYREEIRKLREYLDAVEPSVKNRAAGDGKGVSATLWKLLTLQENLSQEIDSFCRQVESIDSFMAERERVIREGAPLIEKIESLVSSGDSLPQALKRKADTAVADFRKAVRTAEEIPAKIRTDLRSGHRSAGWSINEMKERLAALGAVLEEMGSR